jgi:hypothetical protein
MRSIRQLDKLRCLLVRECFFLFASGVISRWFSTQRPDGSCANLPHYLTVFEYVFFNLPHGFLSTPSAFADALSAACCHAHNAVVDVLMEAPGIDVNVVCRNGQTVLHALVESGNEDSALWMVSFSSSSGVFPLPCLFHSCMAVLSSVGWQF